MKLLFPLLIFTCFSIVTPTYGSNSLNADNNCSKKEQEEIQTQKNFANSQIAIADEMTNKLEAEFNRNNATVVLLGNVGRDVSDRNITTPSDNSDINFPNKYMHGGLAYKNPATNSWKIIHLLNIYHCGKMTNKSNIVNDKLRSFFTHTDYKMDIQMQIPSHELQAKLLKVILGSPELLHQDNYNVISNPSSLKYQNSNQFILDVIATAQIETPTCQKAISDAIQKVGIQINDHARKKAQLCAFANGFKPAIMNAKTYESIGASLDVEPEISVDDHSWKSRFSSKYPWVSYPSLSDYLKTSDPKSSPKIDIYPNIGRDKTKHELFVLYRTQQDKTEDTGSNQ